VVYAGYTPGYLGTEVCPDHVVVYGTGWNYPPYIEATGLARPAPMDLARGSPTTGELDSGSGLERANCWGVVASVVGALSLGLRHHVDYDRVSLNHVNIYHHWGQASHMPNTGTDSTSGTVANGRTIGAATSVHTRAMPLTIPVSRGLAPTTAISTRMFQNRP